MKFIELGVLPAVCDYLEKQKITSPTPVQEKAIPIALGDKDIVVTAKTGTGKTLAYLLPIVQRLHAEKDSMALVLVPTRELATQVQSVLSSLLNSLKMPPACVLIGGVSFRPQLDALRKSQRL